VLALLPEPLPFVEEAPPDVVDAAEVLLDVPPWPELPTPPSSAAAKPGCPVLLAHATKAP